ncbi:MAG TPA: HAMP domain-containing sensor histidine kinase, partial [Lysobacter sp.]
VRAQRNEALALLTAGLGHDLRNVLQPLGLCAHLLRAGADVARVASVVEECARRGHDLAQAMVDFARGQNHGRDTCRIADVLDGVRLLLAGSVPPSVALRIEDRTGDAEVHGHATELQQCLLNLCLNGVQAMEGLPADALEVDAWTDDAGQVWIQVRDTGHGMPPDVLDRLFTPFFTTKREGTGLGLLSCRRIMESLGGELQVQSAVGVGTSMRLRLRAADAPEANADRQPAHEIAQ